ncbi:hypothetical protein [Halalkalicoccus tibetensis]|uniref:Trypsin-like serine protease n=1 Tax=Halalkalicoccus tibetensis TaxID=175632 RepID=A0ABD5V1X0_9EURY
MSVLPGIGIAAGDNNTIEVASAFDGEEVILYETVSKEWWEEVKRTEEIHREVSKQYLDLPEITSVSITGSNEEIEGHTELQIRAMYDSDIVDLSYVDSIVPESVDGVNIETIEAPPDELQCTLRGTNDPVRGGWITAVEGGGGGTLCARAYWESTDTLTMLTAAHVAAGQGKTGCDSSPIGNRLSQSSSWAPSREIGSVLNYHESYDWAAIEIENNDLDFSGHVQRSENNSINLVGSYTNYAKLIDDFDPVYKRGATTQFQSGYCTAYNESANLDCVTFNGEGVEVEVGQTAAGDSGGPTYTIINNDAFLVSLHAVGRGSLGDVAECSPTDARERPRSVGLSSEFLSDSGFRFGRTS